MIIVFNWKCIIARHSYNYTRKQVVPRRDTSTYCGGSTCHHPIFPPGHYALRISRRAGVGKIRKSDSCRVLMVRVKWSCSLGERSVLASDTGTKHWRTVVTLWMTRGGEFTTRPLSSYRHVAASSYGRVGCE